MDTLRPRFDELPDALLSRQQIRTPFPEWHAENGLDFYYIQDDGSLSYNGGDDDDDGSWYDPSTWFDDIGNWFGDLFGGGGGYGPPHGGIPGVAAAQGGIPGTTQLNSGSTYLAGLSYNGGSTGVSSGAWAVADAGPGLDRDGMSSIAMNYASMNFNIPCGSGIGICGGVSTPAPSNTKPKNCLGEAFSDGRGTALALDLVGDVAIGVAIANPASLTALAVGQAASVLATANSIQHTDWTGVGVGLASQTVGATGIVTHGLEVGAFIREGEHLPRV
ncbi:hypothetical protein SAMN05421771_3434 [Granulicella pectinivorans]|uniref:Uncharacterized protein n=1 Tax=Granulicella pectinivorans TaxID=474950 RepID=A0A1I6MRL9_9BACT|nr:hypothetical protein [Granulicella pectinivorans]SFS18342.1 hypothetical protein SAMN05421771_3434 [Granulicella pectinivorans]